MTSQAGRERCITCLACAACTAMQVLHTGHVSAQCCHIMSRTAARQQCNSCSTAASPGLPCSGATSTQNWDATAAKQSYKMTSSVPSHRSAAVHQHRQNQEPQCIPLCTGPSTC